MNAFPFICSRTKNQDFRADYLVRPDDLEWQLTKPYISDAMYDLNSLKDFRYAVFSVGNYCILGIGCLSRDLVSCLKYDIDKDYLRDKVGRSLACFIGFAIPLNNDDSGFVPNMVGDKFLKICCEVYFKHLSKQWLNTSVVSEKVDVNGNSSLDGSNCLVDLPEVTAKPLSVQFEETYKKIKVSKMFNLTDTSYFLNQIINNNSQTDSFISHIDYEDQWQRVKYKNIIISSALYSNLPRLQTRDEENANKEVLRKIKELEDEQFPLLNDYATELSNKVKDLNSKVNQLKEKLEELEKSIKSLKIDSAEDAFKGVNCIIEEINKITTYNYDNIVNRAQHFAQNIESVSLGNNSTEVLASRNHLLLSCQNIYDNSQKLKFNTSEYEKRITKLNNDYNLAKELKSIQNDVDKIVISDNLSIDILKNAIVSYSNIKSRINEFKSNNTKFIINADELLRSIENKVKDIITQKEKQIEQVQAEKEIHQNFQISNDNDLIEVLKRFTELEKIIKDFIGDPINYLISYLNKSYSPDPKSGKFSRVRVYTIDQGDEIINLLISWYCYQFLKEGINVEKKKNLELKIPEKIFRKYYR